MNEPLLDRGVLVEGKESDIDTFLKGRRYGNTILKTKGRPHSVNNIFTDNMPYRILTHFNAMN